MRRETGPLFLLVFVADLGGLFGRAALVGDAASTPRPHIGFGVSKAGAEAQALALPNYDDIDRVLAAYNAARQPLSERIVSQSRMLGTQLVGAKRASVGECERSRYLSTRPNRRAEADNGRARP